MTDEEQRVVDGLVLALRCAILFVTGAFPHQSPMLVGELACWQAAVDQAERTSHPVDKIAGEEAD